MKNQLVIFESHSRANPPTGRAGLTTGQEFKD